MSKRKSPPQWTTWDDQKLPALQGIVGNIHAAVFSLELLLSRWEKMPDDEVEPIIEMLREAHGALGEVFEALEEQRDEADEE